MTFPILGGNGAVAGYQIDNSLRFNDNDSAGLSRTPSSNGNRKIWTFSVWVKRGNIDSLGTFFGAGSNNPDTIIKLNSDNTFEISRFSSGYTNQVTSSQLFRDVSAWYHLVGAVDTTQATASNRVKMYVNGNQITDFSISSYPSLNFQYELNSTSYTTRIGRHAAGQYFDGYLSEFNFIDGQQLDASSFGEFDSASGIWKPKEYTGTYGTNGFYLDFEDSGSLGADQSGNGNNFTPTNLASTDQTTDTPTNNFSTLNSLANAQGATLSEGSLRAVGNANDKYVYSTFGLTTGKWYFEVKDINQGLRGLIYISDGDHNESGNPTNYVNLGLFNGGVSTSGTVNSSLSAFSTNDILCVALDLDNGQVWFSKNANINTGTTANVTGLATSGLDRDYRISYRETGSPVTTVGFNFGNPFYSISSGNTDDNGYGNFEYAPPSGYLALCTQNLATELSPTIDDGSKYFNTVLYTGTGSSLGVTGVGFQPDWTWIKGRSGATEHVLTDSSRGVTEELSSNDNGAEETVAQGLTAFGTDGFTVGTDGSYNTSSATYASWNWLANGGTTSSNTDGSITSTVQANTTAGFSIVTYTGNVTAGATVGHGLGKTPKMLIVKNRDSSLSWNVYHAGVSSDSETDYLVLDGTDAVADNVNRWNDTAPTSSVFTVGTSNRTNGSGENYVAYCFAEIEGYSKFGSYIGNGSDDGTFIYTGFRPAFVMMKKTSGTGNWNIFDSTRDIDNVGHHLLFANLNNAEETTTSNRDIDFLSNGFKQREGSNQDTNGSGGTYIYYAIAESPFVSSTSIPVTAR